ncbi:hypothetical protein P8452_34433 [Trifolium repens]|nr:hypothetical protein P8452_34433 [Trifolium repens]
MHEHDVAHRGSVVGRTRTRSRERERPIPSFHPFNVLDLQLRINGHYQIKLHKATNYHKGLQIKIKPQL